MRTGRTLDSQFIRSQYFNNVREKNFWHLVRDHSINDRWDMVEWLIRNNPNINFGASPSRGFNKGISVLCRMAAYKKWDLVRLMLALNPLSDVDTAPACHKIKGTTVLWLAMAYGKLDIVNSILDHHPAPNLKAAPAKGNFAGMTVLQIAERYKAKVPVSPAMAATIARIEAIAEKMRCSQPISA